MLTEVKNFGSQLHALFAYLDLVPVCLIKLQVALKLENNLRFLFDFIARN